MTHQPIFCSTCGAQGEAGCNCGAEYISASAFAAKAIANNPEMSNRAIATEIGVSFETVRRARPTDTNVSVEKRMGKDGKMRSMPKPPSKPRITRRAKPEESVGYSDTAERHIVIETGENISRTSAIKLEAKSEAERKVVELEATIREINYELSRRPTLYDLRRIDSVANHVQRIITDIDTYNLIKRCVHPDSRNSVSDTLLHEAWLAFNKLEALTWDKRTAPEPLPATVDELWRRREAAREARSKKRI